MSKSSITIRAADIISLVDDFRRRNPDDWLQKLHLKTTDLGQGFSTGDISAAIRSGRFTGWEEFVSEDESDFPPTSLVGFIKGHYGVQGWEPKPYAEPSEQVVLEQVEKKETLSSTHTRASGNNRKSETVKKQSITKAFSAKSIKPKLPKEIPAHKIYHWAMAWMSNNEGMPSPETRTVINDLTIEDISSLFKSKRVTGLEAFGFSKKKLPENFVDFINGTNAFARSRGAQALIEEMKVSSLQHYNFHKPSDKPTWPADRRKRSPVLFGRFADGETQWSDVTTNVRRQNGIFSETYFGDEYGPYVSVHDFLVRTGLKEGKPDFSKDLLNETITAFKADKNSYPEKRLGKVMHGRLALYDESYIAIDSAFILKIRGLQDSPYNTFHDYLVGEGFLQITLEQILDSARKTKKANAPFKGVIKYGALANGERTWESVVKLFQKQSRLLSESALQHKTLRQLFIDHGITQAPIRAKMIPAIAQCARLHIAAEGKSPPARGGLIQYGSLKGKYEWAQIEQAANDGNLPPYKSLYKLMVGEGVVVSRYKNQSPEPEAA